eukprot:scaffold204103_cov22-Tisochrysis_lutea.AAC.2
MGNLNYPDSATKHLKVPACLIKYQSTPYIFMFSELRLAEKLAYGAKTLSERILCTRFSMKTCIFKL